MTQSALETHEHNLNKRTWLTPTSQSPTKATLKKENQSAEFQTIALLLSVAGYNFRITFILWMSFFATMMGIAYSDKPKNIVEKLQIGISTLFAVLGLGLLNYNKLLHLQDGYANVDIN